VKGELYEYCSAEDYQEKKRKKGHADTFITGGSRRKTTTSSGRSKSIHPLARIIKMFKTYRHGKHGVPNRK